MRKPADSNGSSTLVILTLKHLFRTGHFHLECSCRNVNVKTQCVFLSHQFLLIYPLVLPPTEINRYAWQKPTALASGYAPLQFVYTAYFNPSGRDVPQPPLFGRITQRKSQNGRLGVVSILHRNCAMENYHSQQLFFSSEKHTNCLASHGVTAWLIPGGRPSLCQDEATTVTRPFTLLHHAKKEGKLSSVASE